MNLTIGLKCDIDISALEKRGRVQQKDELLHRDESLKETSTPFMSPEWKKLKNKTMIFAMVRKSFCTFAKFKGSRLLKSIPLKRR